MAKKKKLSVVKARKMLKEGMVRGKPLTKKQKGFFGMVAGGSMPMKKSLMEKMMSRKPPKRYKRKYS